MNRRSFLTSSGTIDKDSAAILLATLVVVATYPLSASPPAPAQDIRALMQRVNA